MSARILVVEDNAPSLLLARTVLEHAGHVVLEAQDGSQALSIVRADAPDLVLMDVQLPGMCGIEACRLLKADPTTADIPVVALTALAMAGDRERLLAAGFDAYLAKPVRYRDLVDLVDELLTTRRDDQSS